MEAIAWMVLASNEALVSSALFFRAGCFHKVPRGRMRNPLDGASFNLALGQFSREKTVACMESIETRAAAISR